MSDDRWRELDDELGRFARSRTGRVVGWLAVAAWVVFVSLALLEVIEL